MTAPSHGRPSRAPAHKITRRPSTLRVNAAAHIELDDLILTSIDRLGVLARGLDLTDESDARIYSRRVAGLLGGLTLATVGGILERLGGDPTVDRSLVCRITAVQAIVTSTWYWRNPL